MLRLCILVILLTSCSMIPPEDEKIIFNDFEKVEDDIIQAELERSQQLSNTADKGKKTI